MFWLNRRWFQVLRDDGGEGGTGGSDSDDKGSDDGKSDDPGEKPPEFDVDAWLAEQSEEARAALATKYDTDTAGLKSALAKERDARAEADKAKSDFEKKQAEADDEALAEAKKFEELAGKRKESLDASQGEVAVLKASGEKLEARAKEAEAVVEKHLEAQKAAMELKPHILELLKPMKPTAQLEFLAEHADELGAKKGGFLPDSPGESGNGSKMADEERQKITVRSWQ